MATEEMKTEPKKTEQNQSSEVKDLPPPQQHTTLPSLPLPLKTCSFKVSIHCEGCKRKVKKILTTIEGVYKVDIDVKQQKVTVMGIAAPEFLLKKLLKAGKHADLLPDIPDPEETKPVDPEETKPVDPKENTKKKKNKKKEQKTETNDGATSSGGDKPESKKPDAAGECGSGDGGERCGTVKDENKAALKEKDSVPADTPSPAAEKKFKETGGNIGKKKKKKGQSMSSVSKTTGEPVRTESPPPATTPAADHDRPINQNGGLQTLANNNPPRHDMYPYPPSYYAPEIMYGVSYNVAQPPVNVYGGSYYTPPPPHSYAYMHPGYLPYDQNPYQSRPSDSFELFSDENPNGCSVM